MIKSKFGDALRSRTKTAQVNEALCKILCHNICCLIQSIFEFNIESKFWPRNQPCSKKRSLISRRVAGRQLRGTTQVVVVVKVEIGAEGGSRTRTSFRTTVFKFLERHAT